MDNHRHVFGSWLFVTSGVIVPNSPNCIMPHRKAIHPRVPPESQSSCVHFQGTKLLVFFVPMACLSLAISYHKRSPRNAVNTVRGGSGGGGLAWRGHQRPRERCMNA